MVVLWSRDEPERLGEVAFLRSAELAAGTVFLGRESEQTSLVFVRQRPGEQVETGCLRSPKISRRQLAFDLPVGQPISVENIGRGALLVNDVVVERAELQAGDLIEIDRRLLLLFSSRPRELPWSPLDRSLTRFEFGRADAFGFVGESPAAWAQRSRIHFLARRDHHVLITGPSGTGKELAARALHALSARSHKRLVARSAATIPDTLIDAELFGNAKDYPNPGMRERGGLIGAANGSTLFLDEIGELSHELQAHLLRVMELGEYQQLGDTRTHTSDLRLIAATNRSIDELKHDFAARFGLRLRTDGLERRPEDVPLLVRHVVGQLVRDDPDVVGTTGSSDASEVAPLRPTCALVKLLVRRPYVGHIRELTALLWQSLAEYRPPHLRVPEHVSSTPTPRPGATAKGHDATEPSRAEMVRALEAADWVIERAWPGLGLRNRYQLRRLMDRHDITMPRAPARPELTSEQIVSALEHCGGVKERAWRALGLRNRHELARLLRLHRIDH